jgi:hypothetical protein
LEPQAVPAFRAPALSDTPPLEHEVWTSTLAQPVAHRQARLTATDDEGLDLLD